MADEPMSWELRDKELWLNTGIEGEIFGEKSDGWVKPIDKNGFLTL